MHSAFRFHVVMAVCLAMFGCGGSQDPQDTAESRAASSPATAVTIYADALASGWSDWSWTPSNMANIAPVAAGTRSVSVIFQPRAAIFYRYLAGISTVGLTYLEFQINGGTAAGAALEAYTTVSRAPGPSVRVAPYCTGGTIPANGWTRCRVPLAVIGGANKTIDGFMLRESLGRSLPTMYLDSIQLSTETQPVTVSVSPATASLSVRGTTTFSAAVAGSTNTSVTWTVAEGAAGGTISTTGLYTAPATAGTYHVVATSAADTTKSATATVAVNNQPISVSINPTTATLSAQGTTAFSATVSGSTNTSVIWSITEGAVGGSISTTGLYTAPATAGTYHVVATSAADTTKSATATVTVNPPVAIAISPTSASITAQGTTAFSATVSGSTNNSVTWSVAEGSVGGSVSTTGLYTAPSSAGTFRVIATSVADPTKSATATVTIIVPPPPVPTVAVSISPSTASLLTQGTTTFTAAVSGSSNTSVTWAVAEGTAGGSVSATGLYTAPAAAGTYHVVATSVADATKSVAATVTVSSTPTPPTPITGGGWAVTSASCAAEPLTPASWQPSTRYVFGQRVTNDLGRVYQVISVTGGTSASSGGPTGTNSSIADGSVTWAYSMATATGRIFYVCDCASGADSRCSPGNDSNNGNSASTPWRSLDRARNQFNTMAAGDTIALCRGGVFAQANDSSWGNSACRATNNCTLRDYYAPWDSNRSANLPNISSGAGRARGMPFMSGGAGYRVINLRLSTSAGVTWGYGLSNTLTDLTICNNVIDGFGMGVQDDCGDHSPTTARTVILGSRILNNHGQGVLIGGNGSVVADNYFDGNGSLAVYDHSIYLTNHANSPATIRVTGNEIHHNTFVGGACRGVDIVAHGQHANLLIENNLIDNAGIADGSCWGIQLSPGAPPTYPYAEFFQNAVIRNNRIYGVGSVGIGVDMCTNCLIENNLITVDGNGSGGVEALKAPTQTYLVNGSPHSSNITVRNNTIYFSPGASSGTFLAISSAADGSGHVIANNALVWAGSGGYFSCFNLRGSYSAVTRNSCYGGPVGFNAPDTVLTPPQFTNPGSGTSFDFTPLAGSPLVGAANASYAPSFDLTGKARGSSPDIGAYER